MTDQDDKQETDEEQEAMEQAIANGVRSGKLRTTYDPARRQLLLHKPGVTKANPHDLRRN